MIAGPTESSAGRNDSPTMNPFITRSTEDVSTPTTIVRLLRSLVQLSLAIQVSRHRGSLFRRDSGLHPQTSGAPASDGRRLLVSLPGSNLLHF
jgi:hypothetical protein